MLIILASKCVVNWRSTGPTLIYGWTTRKIPNLPFLLLVLCTFASSFLPVSSQFTHSSFSMFYPEVNWCYLTRWYMVKRKCDTITQNIYISILLHILLHNYILLQYYYILLLHYYTSQRKTMLDHGKEQRN